MQHMPSSERAEKRMRRGFLSAEIRIFLPSASRDRRCVYLHVKEPRHRDAKALVKSENFADLYGCKSGAGSAWGASLRQKL